MSPEKGRNLDKYEIGYDNSEMNKDCILTEAERSAIRKLREDCGLPMPIKD